MKQFNLEEYLANPSRKVVTRDGRDVRIICTDFDNPDFPVIGEIKGYKWPLSFATNGKTIKWRQLSGDLFFAPEKHEGQINLYKSGINWSLGASIWQTEAGAKKWVGATDYTATIKIEWEE